MTTINQDTAEECLEPLRTMAAVRTGAQLGFEAAPGDTANFRTSVFMGMNLVVTEGAGCVLRVGDALRVGVR